MFIDIEMPIESYLKHMAIRFDRFGDNFYTIAGEGYASLSIEDMDQIRDWASKRGYLVHIVRHHLRIVIWNGKH